MLSKLIQKISRATIDDDTCPHCRNLSPEVGSDSLKVNIRVKSLAKLSRVCPYCKLIHDAHEQARFIVGEVTTVTLECTSGRPIVMYFDSLHAHYQQWFLLYKPYGTEISSWQTIGGPGPQSDHLGSNESLRFIKECLDDCLRNTDGCHDSCQQSERRPLPTRLLDVRDGQVRLCETKGSHGDYCALSYRWGPPEHAFKTTRANIDDMMRGINWEKLPRLLQDAVTLTRWLGISYLWVDALCIVQGDKADWETEALKMGPYYGQAVLTIAASSALEVGDPFLVPRTALASNLIQALTFVSKDGTTSDIVGRKVLNYAGISVTGDSLLSTRAWTFQENVLATRIAHFTQCEIIWECRSQQRYENGARLSCAAGLAFRFSKAADNPEYSWKTLVTEYSKRRLTYESDRLPAVSAIASELSGSITGRYLAGVWQQWIFSELAWEAAPWTDMPTRTAPISDKPSWSWASIQGHVVWDLGVCEQSDRHSAIALIDAECPLRGRNPFGDVAEMSSIVVEAPLIAAEVSCANVLTSSGYAIVLKDEDPTDSPFLLTPDTVLLAEATSIDAQGSSTGVSSPIARRASKDELAGAASSMWAAIVCLFLGGGTYTYSPGRRLPSLPSTHSVFYYLVLTPFKGRNGSSVPTFSRVGLVRSSSKLPKKAKPARVRLV